MTIEHKDITDPNRHEPRGISTATVNTTYVADGLGSGSWRNLKSTDFTGLTGDGGVAGKAVLSNGADGFIFDHTPSHGSMTITNNTVNFPVTAVADTTFNTPEQFTLITGTGAPWASETLNNVTFDTQKLTVAYSGIYQIELWGNINGFPGNNAKIAFRYRVNGTTFSSRKPTVKTDSISSPQQIGGFGLLQLTAGDYLELMVASDTTGNILFADLNTTVVMIREMV